MIQMAFIYFTDQSIQTVHVLPWWRWSNNNFWHTENNLNSLQIITTTVEQTGRASTHFYIAIIVTLTIKFTMTYNTQFININLCRISRHSGWADGSMVKMSLQSEKSFFNFIEKENIYKDWSKHDLDIGL